MRMRADAGLIGSPAKIQRHMHMARDAATGGQEWHTAVTMTAMECCAVLSLRLHVSSACVGSICACPGPSMGLMHVCAGCNAAFLLTLGPHVTVTFYVLYLAFQTSPVDASPIIVKLMTSAMRMRAGAGPIGSPAKIQRHTCVARTVPTVGQR